MEDISREELERLVEKARKNLEETLSKMTPEERAAAEERANRMMAEDAAETQRLIDAAAKIAAGNMPDKKNKELI